MHFMGKLGLEKVSKRSRRDPDHEKTFLTFTLSVNKIILYRFSMFKSLDSIASVVGMFMYLTISKLKQVLRSRKGLGKVSTTTLTTSVLEDRSTFFDVSQQCSSVFTHVFVISSVDISTHNSEMLMSVLLRNTSYDIICFYINHVFVDTDLCLAIFDEHIK